MSPSEMTTVELMEHAGAQPGMSPSEVEYAVRAELRARAQRIREALEGAEPNWQDTNYWTGYVDGLRVINAPDDPPAAPLPSPLPANPKCWTCFDTGRDRECMDDRPCPACRRSP